MENQEPQAPEDSMETGGEMENLELLVSPETLEIRGSWGCQVLKENQVLPELDPKEGRGRGENQDQLELRPGRGREGTQAQPASQETSASLGPKDVWGSLDPEETEVLMADREPVVVQDRMALKVTEERQATRDQQDSEETRVGMGSLAQLGRKETWEVLVSAEREQMETRDDLGPWAPLVGPAQGVNPADQAWTASVPVGPRETGATLGPWDPQASRGPRGPQAPQGWGSRAVKGVKEPGAYLGHLVAVETMGHEASRVNLILLCCKGPEGSRGQPGPEGLSGDLGNMGPIGQKGEAGRAGEDGLLGVPGPTGKPGPKGKDFFQEVLLIPGDKGLPGYHGYEGQVGSQGVAGRQGPAGSPGPGGPSGGDGPAGLPGVPGPKGDSGPLGSQGIQGDEGLMGAKGLPGTPGPPGPFIRGEPDSFLFTRHSQQQSVPLCPAGSRLLFSGYSLLFINGNNRAHGQDLGTLGSCLPRFTTMPFLFCNIDSTCRYASRNDYSYWLSTDQSMPSDMAMISGDLLEKYVSRCAVCETRSNVIGIHSQTVQVPVCPAGWQSLWSGYSFVMQTGVGSEGSGQPLASPGSCLQEFRKIPFIECHGRGTCNYYTDSYSYWLAALDPNQLFSKPRAQTVKGDCPGSIISRCRVCMKQW
ncbi:unnamed protein product [Arctogadus glacialis]